MARNSLVFLILLAAYAVAVYLIQHVQMVLKLKICTAGRS